MSTDWEEVKRLAADLQRAQLTSTLQKLSERNCVEIVTLLLENKLIEVVYTNDGKEYITPEHLEREIQDELYVNNGRVNLVEVSKSLNVDLNKIEQIACKIAQENVQIHFILGQLIDEDYITYIAEEINEKLSQRGQININDLTEQFDLPSNFLQRDVVEKHLGKLIKGRQDPSNPRVFFTQAYLQRCKAKIRGALAALTRPTTVSIILQHINIPQKVFNTLIDEINTNGQITSKQANAQYIPHIYTKNQSDWVNNFFGQNGFIEYDSLSKLGITNVKQYINKQFPDEKLIFLKRCAVSEKLIEFTVIPALMATKQFIDLGALLPSNMSASDRDELFEALVNKQNKANNNSINNKFTLLSNDMGSIVLTTTYLEELSKPCREMACALAQTSVATGAYQQYIATKQYKQCNDDDNDGDIKADKKDERRKKAASGKAGGGSQGRETKTKSTKKHVRSGGKKNSNPGDSDDELSVNNTSKLKKQLELVTMSDIINILDKQTREMGLEYLNKDLAAMYYDQLNQLALKEAQVLYEITLRKIAMGGGQTHAAVQERINTLIIDMRLYEKGLKVFPSNVQIDLTKYLLKSLGNDICNELMVYIAQECQIELKTAQMNVDQRNKLAAECGNYKMPLLELNKAINKNVDDFILATESVLNSCSMIIKKVDKKKDRLLIGQHKQQLLIQLEKENEPAVILHLIVLTLFTAITGCILHASGKFVVHILNFIKSSLNEQQNQLLQTYHDSVINILRLEKQSEEYETIMANLQELQSPIKALANDFEKRGLSKTE